jgi:cobalamin biosynthesis Mg chelatase CobN
MLGMRQSPAPVRGRSILALSAAALLALSFLPAFAQAQSSAEVEYQDAPPTVPGHTGGRDAKDKEPSANKANTGGGSGGGSNSPGGGSAKGGSSDKTGNAARDNGGYGDQQGSQSGRANKDSGGAQVVVPASTSEDDGGSSPLVPILIAIAVLAAISIGVVVMRQRRGHDASPGSPASPKAG